MSTRFELFAALCCLALPDPSVEASFRAAVAPLQVEVPSKTPAQRFGAAFNSWRAGDGAAAALVKSIADDMCAQSGRADVPKIVAHYAALTKQQRAEGFALEQRVEGLRDQLEKARDEGVRGEELETFLASMEIEIEAACTDSAKLADLGARAQALALRAEYCIARLESQHGTTLTPEARARIAEQVSADARAALVDYQTFDIVHGALNPQSSLARTEHFRGRLSSARAAYEELAANASALHDRDWAVEASQGMLAIANERGDELESEHCLELLACFRDAQTDWPLARAWSMRLIHSVRASEARDFLAQFRAPDATDNSMKAITTRHELAFVRAEALLRTGQLDLAKVAAAEAAYKTVYPFEQRFLEARIELACGQAQAAIARIADPEVLSALAACDAGAAHTLLGEARLALGDARAAKAELSDALALAEAQRQQALVEPLITPDEAQRFNFIGAWDGAGLETVALLARANLKLGDPLGAALASEDWQSRSLRGDNDELAALRARVGEPPLREPLTAKHLEAWADTLELGLVTWVFGADSGAVVHVKASAGGGLDCAGESIAIGRETLQEAVRRLRERAIAGLDTKTLALEIRDALLPAGIRAHIGRPHADTDRLLLLVHGPLEALPFELLGLGEKRFDEELCLLTLPGLPALEPGPRLRDHAFDHWQLLGSPVDGAQSDARATLLLPGASMELSELSKLRPDAGLAQGPLFQRSAFEHALLSGDCVHVATHLQVKQGEARSRFPAAGLRLDDGEVASASEIAALTPKLPLVVLSACETGGGRFSDGEGLFGVARAFLEGGTRNLLVTLWPVEDDAARDFALTFHRALKAGKSPSQAARLARAALLAAGRPSGDWAAFRFLGRD